MHQPCQPHEPGITSKTETQHQGFESYIITNVCESCTFEIEAYSAFRAIFRLFKPKKFSIRVDKTLYEPGARQPVDPGMSASCPKAPIIGSRVELSNSDAPDVLLVRRDYYQFCWFNFCLGQCSFSLYFSCTREKIHLGDGIKIPAYPFNNPPYSSMLDRFQRGT